MNYVLSFRNGPVLEIVLNRPERLNALDGPSLEALANYLDGAKEKRVRAVLLRGEGRAFCAGQDLREAAAGNLHYQEHLQLYNQVILQMRKLEKPIVVAIQGVAAGAGMALALAADIRIIGTETNLITAFAKIALVPDSGMTYLLPRIVGWGRAFELMALSPKIGAEQALAIGLANQMVPEDQLIKTARKLATELAMGPTRVYGLIKRALNASPELRLEEALELEARLQQAAGAGKDHAEGLRAFLEKRTPTFGGY